MEIENLNKKIKEYGGVVSAPEMSEKPSEPQPVIAVAPANLGLGVPPSAVASNPNSSFVFGEAPKEEKKTDKKITNVALDESSMSLTTYLKKNEEKPKPQEKQDEGDPFADIVA